MKVISGFIRVAEAEAQQKHFVYGANSIMFSVQIFKLHILFISLIRSFL